MRPPYPPSAPFFHVFRAHTALRLPRSLVSRSAKGGGGLGQLLGRDERAYEC